MSISWSIKKVMIKVGELKTCVLGVVCLSEFLLRLLSEKS